MMKIFALICIWIMMLPCTGQNIVTSLKDKTGTLWFSVTERGIYRFDGKSFTRFKGEGTFNNIILCMYEDKSGNLWFKTIDGEICKYDGKEFTKFLLPLPDSNAIGNNRYRTLATTSIEVSGMLEDKKGNLWFLTTNHGVYCYNTIQAKLVGHEQSFSNFILGVAPVCIMESKNGDIFVGCWDGSGAYRYDGNKFTPFNGFSDGMIGCLMEDKAGRLWVGTRIAGVEFWDGEFLSDGRARATNFSKYTKKDKLENTVLCIFQDSKGNIWIGANWNNLGIRGDAFLFDGKTFNNITENERTTRYTDFAVRSFVEDNEGNIWIGSKSGLLLRYDGKTLSNFSSELSK